MTDSKVYNGEVIWFNVEWGYGFISWEKDGIKQPDMFAHFSDIELDGFKLLKAGQNVTFTVGQNNEGKPKATEIVIVR